MSSILLWSCLLANLVYAEVSAYRSTRSIAREDSLQCYSLPYGALGFVGHLITLYTLTCLWRRRRPSNPWRTLGNNPRWVRFIGIMTLTASITFATFAIIRCSNEMSLLVMQGLLNASVSVLLGCTTSSAEVCICESDPSPPSYDMILPESQTSDIEKDVSAKPTGSSASSILPTEASSVQSPDSMESQTTACTSPQSKTGTIKWYAVWIMLYLPFAIVGLVGSARLVNRNWDNLAVQHVTVAAVSASVCWTIFLITVVVTSVYSNPAKKILPFLVGVTLSGAAIGIMAFSPFYSDWVLGAVSGNFAGLPITEDVVDFMVYWGYFVVNLFPMACI
jgi:hypothetical protein